MSGYAHCLNPGDSASIEPESEGEEAKNNDRIPQLQGLSLSQDQQDNGI